MFYGDIYILKALFYDWFLLNIWLNQFNIYRMAITHHDSSSYIFPNP